MPDNKWVAELKTILQVTKARLDVREKKKTELVAKERYTVADYVRNNKSPRARIAVEHLIREDYKIEAMDRVEAYVDTLLMRLQILKDRPKNSHIDPSIEQPLVNVLWASPFLAQEIPELAQVTAMFKKHLGPEYVSICETNRLNMVDVELFRCLSSNHIPKLLVERYLVEICRSQNVAFEPDPLVMAQDEFWTIGERYIGTQHSLPSNDDRRPPPPPPSGGYPPSGGGGVGHKDVAAQPFVPTFEQSPPVYPGAHMHYPNIPAASNFVPPPPPASDPFPQVPGGRLPLSPPPPPPPPPAASGGPDPAGFDDLARRFEILKSRK